MERFTNINIKKEKNRMIRNLIIFILVIGVALLCLKWKQNIIDKVNSEITDLDSIIVSEEDKIDKKAYLDIKSIPYQFAVSDETTDSYYIVSDGKYLYIAYMGVGDFYKLNHEEIKNTPIRVEGITYETTEQIKKLALEAYNEGLDEDEQISESDFDDYFGSVYLNMTVDAESVAVIPLCIAILAGLFGVIGVCVTAYELHSYKSSIKKMDEDLIAELDEEMNSSNAFYYAKSHLYLTDKYIINFGNKFVVINYKDIIWMYPFTQRTNGIKTSQAIKVMDDKGKTHTIAAIDFVTKAKKEVYTEIWNTIVSKNSSMALGYTKENIKEMKERFKKNRL